MTQIDVPTRDQVSPANQAIFDALKIKLGFVPNLYATFAHSEHALANYLALQNGKSAITGKAREVINLVVSQVNDCAYCLAAHTVIAGLAGLKPEQIMEIRAGRAPWDRKLDTLARLTKEVVLMRGHVDPAFVDAFLSTGWTKEHLVDAIIAIGDKVVSNFLHATTRVPIDFPEPPALAA